MIGFMRVVYCCILIVFMAPGLLQAGEKTFTISTSYKSLLSNPEQTGILDHLIQEAFRRIGFRAMIVYNPTGRSLVDVNAGLADAEINRIEGMEASFPNLVRVPEPNMVMHFVAFAREPFPITGWDSLRDLHIGIVRGWKILEDNTQDFPHVTRVPTETELFNMLQRGRIDVALYDKLTGYEQLNLRGFEDIHHLEPPLASRNMYLYLNVKHKDLLEEVAGALQGMKADGTYDQIFQEATAHLRMGGE